MKCTSIQWKITMKYPGIHLKNRNERHWVSNEKPQWNALGIQWKIAMKYPGIHLKNPNEMHWVSNEKPQWNALAIQWKIAMKCTGYVMKGTMYLLKNRQGDGLTDLWNAPREFLIFYEKSQAILWLKDLGSYIEMPFIQF